MCYKKEKGKRERKKKAESNHKPSLEKSISSSVYVAWRNATTGGCKAQRKPRESTAWQSGGGLLKFVG